MGPSKSGPEAEPESQTAHVMTHLLRTTAALLSAALLAGGCSAPDWLFSETLPDEPPPPPPAAGGVTAALSGTTTLASGVPTHGQAARDRGEQLDAMLEVLLNETDPAITEVRHQLARHVRSLRPPPKLATNERGLKGWGAGERSLFQAEVDAAYDQARRQLEQLHGLVMTTATQMALELAVTEPFVDDGFTGDRQLDLRLTALQEVLDGRMALDGLEAAREQTKAAGLELLEAFSTVGLADAEASLDGRLMLFIGGDETAGAPRCMLAYRHDGPSDPAAYTLAQVFRHRIMRGDAVVHEVPWAPAPTFTGAGHFDAFLHEGYLVAEGVQPIINRDAPDFHELLDMRIVSDVQSAVIGPGGEVLGGVDWRIQFAVSRRGDLTWNVAGGEPRWDPWCTEVRRVLGHGAPAGAE